MIVKKPANLSYSYNIGNKGTLAEFGTNSKVANPLFINVTTVPPNFNLQATSPAINIGFTNNLAFDYNGKQRNVGKIDIGACEYNATTAYTLPDMEVKPVFSKSTTNLVAGDYVVEDKSGVVATVKCTIDSVNGKISAIRFRGLTIPRGSKILNAQLKLYNFSSNFSTFNCVKISAEDAANAQAFNTTAFSVSTKLKTQNFAVWNPFTVKTAATILTPSVDYVVQEIISKPTWASGNAITFLFDYYTTPKVFTTGYSVDPYLSFDAYVTTPKIKGAQLIVEYVPPIPTAIESMEGINDKVVAFANRSLEKLLIKSESSLKGSVKVINSLGAVVKNCTVSDDVQSIEFDIHGLSSGVYLIEVKKNSAVSVVKVIL
jgi:hypothetical protein